MSRSSGALQHAAIESGANALIGTRMRWQHIERTGEVKVPA